MSATAPLPALVVASAVFFRPECTHEQLFHAEYKRSNRTKGLKILRCFPHCCPEHIDRSYCGTSLSVRVELEFGPPDNSPARTSPPSEVVAVFARFEAVSDISLLPGECVEVARIAVSTQSERSLEGRWVAGTLDRPSRIVTTIRPPGTPLDDHKPLVFHLNGKPLSRWYYGWESGANKAQRLMKHVLKAYIVERCAIDRDGNFTDFTGRNAHTQLYRVLSVVTSPEFTVVSYRRALSEKYRALMERDALEYAEASPSSIGNFDEKYSQYSSMSTSINDRFQPPEALKPESVYTEAHRNTCQRTPARPVSPNYFAESSAELEGKLRWEYTNSSAVDVSRDIALVYSFLRWAPLSVYVSCVDEIVHFVHQSLNESFTAEAREVSKLNCFSRFLFDQVGAKAATAGVPIFFAGEDKNHVSVDLPKELESLLRALAQATRWFFSSDTRQWIRAFFHQYAESVLDTHAIRACFVLFVQELQGRLDAQVFVHTEVHTLANAAEEVIAAVYSYPYFHAKRPKVRNILSGQNFTGWNAFVAQMRQTYISLSRCRPGLDNNSSRLTFDGAHPSKNCIECDWNGDWLLDVDEAAWKFSDQTMENDKDDIGDSHIGGIERMATLFNVFETISQMVRLQVAIDVQTSTLYIRSTQGIANTLGCMRVILDDKDRVFSQFPNGVATATDTGAHGNYIGELRVEESDRVVAYLQISSWSASQNGHSYTVRTRIECSRSHRLCISGDVLVTTTPDSFTTDKVSSLGEMSLRKKRAAVVEAHTTQHSREHEAANGSVAGIARKEFGEFHLCYTKI